MLRPRIIAATLAFLGLVIGLSAVAAGGETGDTEDLLDLSLEDLLNVSVTTASRSERSLDQVPGSVTVISAKEIKRYGLKTLADAMTIIPGFNSVLRNHNAPFNHVRGYAASGSHLKVMIDGYPVNMYYERGIAHFEYYPLDNVKQIEVIRGPGSALYGTDAFCGVINIITDKDERTTLSATGGEFGHKGAGVAYYRNPKSDVSYSLTVDILRRGRRQDRL